MSFFSRGNLLLRATFLCFSLVCVAEKPRKCLPPKSVRAQPFSGLTIVAEVWSSSKVFAEIALILLSERLGFKDAKIKSNEKLSDSWTESVSALADGEAHLAFEKGSVSVENAKKTSAFERVRVDNYVSLYGELRLLSRRGPDGRPGIGMSLESALKTASGIDRFAPHPSKSYHSVPFTASAAAKSECASNMDGALQCDDDGIFRPSVCHNATIKTCPAQMLALFQGRDARPTGLEQFIEDNKLPLEVVFSDLAARSALLWEVARADWNADALVLLQYPPVFSFVDIEKEFVALELPVQFGPRGPLSKWSWPEIDFEAEDAAAFRDAFQIDSEQYSQMARIYLQHGDAWSTACDWLLKNPSVWEPWIQFPSRKNPHQEYQDFLMQPLDLLCFTSEACEEHFGIGAAGIGDDQPMMASLFCVIQLALGLFLAVVYPRVSKCCFSSLKNALRQAGDGMLGDSKCCRGLYTFVARIVLLLLSCVDAEYKTEHDKHAKWLRNNHVRRDAQSLFCQHTRTFENFCRPNTDASCIVPPGSPLEVEGLYSSHFVRWGLLASASSLRRSFAVSLGLGLVCGGVGSYFSLLETYQNQVDKSWGEEPSRAVYNNFITPLADVVGSIAGDFRFFPSFAALGLLAHFIRRWRNFYFAAWRVEGRLKDMSVIVGSSVVNTQDHATQRALYNIYRYMTAAMGMQYKLFLKDFGDDPLGSLAPLGLLTPEEIEVLRPSGSRARDNLLTWIGCTVSDGVRSGIFSGEAAQPCFMDQLTQCRGNMMFFHGNNFFPISNMWTATVQFAVDLWACILVFGAPFRMYVLPSNDLGAFAAWQPWISFGLFPVLFAFWGTLDVCDVLMKPFANDIDTMNIDALMAGTEETLFANLRSKMNLSLTRPKTNISEDPAVKALAYEEKHAALAPIESLMPEREEIPATTKRGTDVCNL